MAKFTMVLVLMAIQGCVSVTAQTFQVPYDHLTGPERLYVTGVVFKF